MQAQWTAHCNAHHWRRLREQEQLARVEAQDRAHAAERQLKRRRQKKRARREEKEAPEGECVKQPRTEEYTQKRTLEHYHCEKVPDESKEDDEPETQAQEACDSASTSTPGEEERKDDEEKDEEEEVDWEEEEVDEEDEDEEKDEEDEEQGEVEEQPEKPRSFLRREGLPFSAIVERIGDKFVHISSSRVILIAEFAAVLQVRHDYIRASTPGADRKVCRSGVYEALRRRAQEEVHLLVMELWLSNLPEEQLRQWKLRRDAVTRGGKAKRRADGYFKTHCFNTFGGLIWLRFLVALGDVRPG